jgi:hypothetical protein
LELRRGFVAGLVGGAAAGFVTALMPVAGLVLLAIGVIAAIVGAITVPATRPKRLATAAGFLISSGGVFLYGSLNVISACQQTEDFCGDANVNPLLITAIVLLALGALSAGGALAIARRMDSR